MHNDDLVQIKVIGVFSNVLPHNSEYLLSQLQKFHLQLPRSPVLVARWVEPSYVCTVGYSSFLVFNVSAISLSCCLPHLLQAGEVCSSSEACEGGLGSNCSGHIPCQ